MTSGLSEDLRLGQSYRRLCESPSNLMGLRLLLVLVVLQNISNLVDDVREVDMRMG